MVNSQDVFSSLKEFNYVNARGGSLATMDGKSLWVCLALPYRPPSDQPQTGQEGLRESKVTEAQAMA